MNDDMLNKILDEAEKEGACSINLGWSAEPLLDKKRFIEVLGNINKRNFLDVFIHTNAVNLDREMREHILKSKITTICISLAEVIDRTRAALFNKITDNIVKFKQERDALGQDHPKIRISIIPTPNNKEYLSKNLDFWKNCSDVVEFQSLAILTKPKGMKRVEGFCSELWRRMAISAKGDIYPCGAFEYFSESLILGNIKDMSIKEAWNSKKHEEIKQNLLNNSICKECLSSTYVLDDNAQQEEN
jgi:radical SAM protein with 4Fe4S-binding SPASM domain